MSTTTKTATAKKATENDIVLTRDGFRAILEREMAYTDPENNPENILPDYSNQLLLKMAQVKEKNGGVWPIAGIEADKERKDRWEFLAAWVSAGRYILGPFLGDLLNEMKDDEEVFEWCWNTLKENADKGIFTDISKLTDEVPVAVPTKKK